MLLCGGCCLVVSALRPTLPSGWDFSNGHVCGWIVLRFRLCFRDSRWFIHRTMWLLLATVRRCVTTILISRAHGEMLEWSPATQDNNESSL